MPRLFHLSSVLNRESIRTNGLDWTLMGAARGIAGNRRPEEDAIFLCRADEVDFFARINNTGGPVDVWAVDGIVEADLVKSGNGFEYFPERIPAANLTFVREVVEPAEDDVLVDSAQPTAYQSRLAITLDDGTELSDDEARAFIERASD